VEVEITVAWSALISDKQHIASNGAMFEVSNEHGWMPDVPEEMERDYYEDGLI
jgi:hypothetical protein